MKKSIFGYDNRYGLPIAKSIVCMLFAWFVTFSGFSQIATTSPAARCGEGSVVLRATGSGTIKWYTEPFYGTPITDGVSQDGTTFTTPYLTVTTTYYVDAVGSDGCSLNSDKRRVPVTATISSNAMQATIYYSSSMFCKSTNTRQQVTLTGTSGGVFSVNPASGLDFSTSNGSILPSNSNPGTYTVTYTAPSTEGCTEEPATTQVTITNALVAPQITYSASPWCSSEGSKSVQLTGATGGTFSASPSGLSINSGTGSISPNGSLSGTYTVTYFVSGTGGCNPQSTTTSVTVLQLPTASISYNSPFTKNQSGQSVAVTGTGGYTGGTFSYTPSVAGNHLALNTTTGQIDPSQSDAGEYTVKYTIAAVTPCTNEVVAQTTVSIYQMPTATIAGNASVCQNSSEPGITFAAQNGTAPFTFTYKVNSGLSQTISTTGGSSQVVVSQPTLIAGSYTYTLLSVTDANRSTQSFTENNTVTVNVNTPAIASFEYSDSPFCSNQSNPSPAFLNGGVAGVFTADSENLKFVSGGTPGVINIGASTAGSYTVTNTIAATGGCPQIAATTNVVITQLPLAGFSYALTTYCQNSGSAPVPTYSTGAVAGTFTSEPAGVRFDATTPGKIDLANSTPGVYKIVNTIAASGGCGNVVASVSDFTIVATPIAPSIAYSGSPYCNTITETQPVELTGSTGGTFAYSRTTSGEGTLSINSTTGSIVPSTSTPGTYHVTYTVGVGSCTSIAGTDVTILESPVITNNSTYAICSGKNTNITLTTNNNMPSTFRWTLGAVSSTILDASAGTGSDISQILSNMSYTDPGTVEYVVTPTSTANSCVGNAHTITVTVNPNPQLIVNTISPVCSPATVDLTAAAITQGSTSGLSFTYWTDFEATAALSTPTAIATTGTYFIKGTTSSGCNAIGEAQVVVNALPDAPTATDITVTYNGTAHSGSATAPEGSHVVWYNDATAGSTTTAPTGTNVGNYTAWAESVADATGCTSATRTMVTVTITQAPLTATSTVASKEYDGTATPGTVTIGTITGLAGTEDLGITASASNYDDANVGSVKATTITYTLNNGTTGIASNYSMADLSTTGSITQKPIAIIPDDNQSKIYGADDPTLNYTYTGSLVEPDHISGALSYFNSGKYTNAGYWSYVLGTLTAGSNYALTISGSKTFTINKIQLTISAPVLTIDKTYDETTTAAVSAGTLAGVINSDEVTVGAEANYDDGAVGTGKEITVTYTLGGAQSGNYQAPVHYVVNTGVIRPAAPTGSATQTFCSGATINDLVATGNAIKWYGASTGGTLLAGTAALVDGQKYYASQSVSGVESTQRLEVTATAKANSAIPVVNPVTTSTLVSGTIGEGDGTIIEVFMNGVSVGITTATGGLWTLSTIELINGQIITAKATATGKCVSETSTGVTVTIAL